MVASASRRGLAPCLPGHFSGSRRTRVEAMYYQCKGLHQTVKRKTSGENKKAEVLLTMKEAKDKKDWAIMTRTTKNKIRRERPNSGWICGVFTYEAQRPLWQKRWNVWNRVRVHHVPRVNGEGRSFGLSALLLPSAGWKELPQTLRTAEVLLR